MCNPELEIDGHPTLACRALNRVRRARMAHALGNELNRLRWHNVYDEIGRTRFARHGHGEWLMYRIDSVGTALEALVDAFSMPGNDTACNVVGNEQYLVSGHDSQRVLRDRPDGGNIGLKSLMQGLKYDENSGELVRDPEAATSPCSARAPTAVAPSNGVVVAYDDLCGGGAAMPASRHSALPAGSFLARRWPC